MKFFLCVMLKYCEVLCGLCCVLCGFVKFCVVCVVFSVCVCLYTHPKVCVFVCGNTNLWFAVRPE